MKSKCNRKFAFWGFVLVGAALVGWWLVSPLVFLYRFETVLPAGVSGSTNVTWTSWPTPSGVPKTYSRHIREFFGWYYRPMAFQGQVPKRLDDVLAEYGARVEGGKLVDANGRNISIMKKWCGTARPLAWDDKQLKLVMEHCTVLVVDVEEDE
jgi:hypothetical protein